MSEIAKLHELLNCCLTALERGKFSTGVCCCGSNVDSHGFYDGHSPVDEGDRYAALLIQDIRQVLGISDALTRDPLAAHESHAMVCDAKFGGDICTACGTPRGSRKAIMPCKFSDKRKTLAYSVKGNRYMVVATRGELPEVYGDDQVVELVARNPFPGS